MTDPDLETDRRLAAYARRYIHARRARDNADSGSLLTAILEVDSAYHALSVAASGTCTQCADGYCPALTIETIQ